MRKDYHWRFDPLTFVWECWVERWVSAEAVCMSVAGWITAECVAQSAVDVKAFFVDSLAGKVAPFRLREVA